MLTACLSYQLNLRPLPAILHPSINSNKLPHSLLPHIIKPAIHPSLRVKLSKFHNRFPERLQSLWSSSAPCNAR
jgi:hypothetical protein